MKYSYIVEFLRRWAARLLSIATRRHSDPHPTVEQLDLDFDQITIGDLPLRDALPIRSAEYWLQLGHPELALKELATLPERVRQHPWPLRVQLAAHHAASSIAA